MYPENADLLPTLNIMCRPYFFMDTNPDPGYMAFVWHFGLLFAHFALFFVVLGMSKLKEACCMKKDADDNVIPPVKTTLHV